MFSRGWWLPHPPRFFMPDPDTFEESSQVTSTVFLPHIDLLLQALRINRERLASRSKIAIDARMLRALLQSLAESLPFSEEFYLETYPDVADAYAAGKIPDLRQHFVDSGYLEGRLGSAPEVDEAFYSATYRDVAQVIARGDVSSGLEHYLRSGASEGRLPNAASKPAVENWMAVLREDGARG